MWNQLCCKGKKLNRLIERSLVNSSTRSITIIRGLWGSRGHPFFYGLSTAGMKYFSGKRHSSGKSIWRCIILCSLGAGNALKIYFAFFVIFFFISVENLFKDMLSWIWLASVMPNDTVLCLIMWTLESRCGGTVILDRSCGQILHGWSLLVRILLECMKLLKTWLMFSKKCFWYLWAVYCIAFINRNLSSFVHLSENCFLHLCELFSTVLLTGAGNARVPNAFESMLISLPGLLEN